MPDSIASPVAAIAEADARALEALIEEARRRARRRRFGYLALVVAGLLIAGGLYLAFGGGDDGPPASDAPSPEPESFAAASGLQLRLAPGWHMAGETLTPNLVNPIERLSVGTFTMLPGGRGCAQLPSRAYGDMAASDGLITLQERGGTHNGYPPRPAHFDLSRDASQLFECAPARMNTHEFAFRDSGRNFYAFAVLGPDAPVGEAERILDSLTVARSSQ